MIFQEKPFINEKWHSFLKLDDIWFEEWFKNIRIFLYYMYTYKRSEICPTQHNIFNMFNQLEPQDIKVFMMFQDPYPQLRNNDCVSNGIGLAASYMTASLKHFYQAIDKDVNLEKQDTTLQYLVKQGVFSINKYIAVKPNRPLRYTPQNMMINNKPLRLDKLMIRVIEKLSKEYDNLIFIFFGKEAQEMSEWIKNKDKHLIIKTSHPSNRGYKHGLMESNFAQKTNDFLRQYNKKEIQWLIQ